MNDKVSVVTVCYNAKECIEDTIISVINQTYNNVEYLIIDGHSTDGTMALVDKYRPKISRIISEKDKGVYDAMNKAISLSTGEWIIFMNAGDKFVSNTVVSDFFEGESYDKSVAVLFGNPIIVYPNSKYERCDKPSNKGYISVNHQCAFTRKSYLDVYKFDLKYKIAADADSFKRIQDCGGTFVYKNIPVAEYEHLDGISSKHRMELNREIGQIYNISHGLRWLFRCLLVQKEVLSRKLFGNAYYVKKEMKICEKSSRYKKIL